MSGSALAAVTAAACAALAAAQLDQFSCVGRDRSVPAEGAVSPSTAAHRLGAIRETPLAMRAIVGIVAGTAGLQVGGAGAGLILAAAGIGGWVARDRRALRRATRRREYATPALARAMADALRGGASVRGALTTASADGAVPEALRIEATLIAHAMALGAPLTDALERLSGQGGPTLRLLCGTTAMHLEAGGALATALDRLAADGEAALRIDEDRIAATAQARATVRVVAALPVLALLAAQAVTGSFVQTIARNPVSLVLLLLGFALEGAAIFASRLIVGPGR